MISQGRMCMETTNKDWKKIKGVEENLKQVQSWLSCYWDCNKSLLIIKHIHIVEADVTFLTNSLRLCCNIEQRNNFSSWLTEKQCCKEIINQFILHTLCPLHEHLHRAEAAVGLFVLCYSLLLGVKALTAKENKTRWRTGDTNISALHFLPFHTLFLLHIWSGLVTLSFCN